MEFRSLLPFTRNSESSRELDPISSLRRDMNRLFGEFDREWNLPAPFRSNGFLSPRIDVAETDSGLEVTAELPGVDQKDIDVEIADGALTLRAERKEEKEEKDEKKRYHLVECSHGAYLRRIELPFEADAEKTEARFDKGVLRIAVKRSPAAARQVRKIAIKAA